ncbi:unnamed protein product [Cyprideis torosa]|uniref:Uncharacterized protein n=1 Tax=Cyprideis torosa TaxID=163714 RepID=A0A7R8WGC7_9CRUS|nr:unnamed protein product [Cyprideis torosa]CAG0896452.1 unnamed protein product [Cyprideis torosa]
MTTLREKYLLRRMGGKYVNALNDAMNILKKRKRNENSHLGLDVPGSKRPNSAFAGAEWIKLLSLLPFLSGPGFQHRNGHRGFGNPREMWVREMMDKWESGPYPTMDDIITKYQRKLNRMFHLLRLHNGDPEVFMNVTPTDSAQLPPRAMHDSFRVCTLPLRTIYKTTASNPYLGSQGGVRMGRLLEEIDKFMCPVAYAHFRNPLQSDSMPPCVVFVTGTVNQINFPEDLVKPNLDLRFRGHVAATTKSTIALPVVVEQGSFKDGWNFVFEATLVAVCRSVIGNSVPVNPIQPAGVEEEEIHALGKKFLSERGQMKNFNPVKYVPSESERQLIHDLFVATMQESSSFVPRSIPKNSRMMSECRQSNVFMCHPEYRNLYGTIFGGWIMRQMYELSFSTAWIFMKEKPMDRFLNEVEFQAPVMAGALLQLEASVVYTEGHLCVSSGRHVSCLNIPMEWSEGPWESMEEMELRYHRKLDRMYRLLLKHDKDSEYVKSRTPTVETVMPRRTMMESYRVAVIPLSRMAHRSLKNPFISSAGELRIGRLLEEVDKFLYLISFSHFKNPLQREGEPPCVVFVTGGVNEISFPRFSTKPDVDLRFRGHVAATTRTTMALPVVVEQGSLKRGWKTIIQATLVVVCRSMNNTAVPVNAVKPTNLKEEKVFEEAMRFFETRKATMSIVTMDHLPTNEERALIHEKFLVTMAKTKTSMQPLVPSDNRMMEPYHRENLHLCHPEYKNIYGKIFGGWMMRQMYELCFATAWVFMREKPKDCFMDEIHFDTPVDAGSLLEIRTWVVYTHDTYCLASFARNSKVKCSADIHDPVSMELRRALAILEKFCPAANFKHKDLYREYGSIEDPEELGLEPRGELGAHLKLGAAVHGARRSPARLAVAW